MAFIKVSDLAEIVKFTWSPTSTTDTHVRHFSIPNYDLGEPFLEAVSELKSSKNLISTPCVLVSKLNPGTPRVWLVESLPLETPVSSTEFIALRPRDLADLRFLYFAMKSPRAVSRLSEQATGTSNSHQRVRPQDVLDLELDLLLDPQTRNAAANFLWALERKIELNKAVSQNLESIAQTLFKSWFVDFDPVRAKMAGEKPSGMDDAAAALFPDSMVESELGEIPEGWSWVALDEVASYLNGLALQKYPVEAGESGLPVIKIAQLRAGHTRGAALASENIDPRFIVEDGDILFSWSGTLEVEIWVGGRGALNQHLFKVTGKEFPGWLAYLGTRSFLDEFRVIAASKATTMGHIQRRHLSEAMLAVPPKKLIEAAGQLIQPLFDLQLNRRLEAEHLASIRDALLPRLISGELEVPESLLVS